MQKDVRILHFSEHLFSIGNEIRRDVAAVELHAFDDFKLGRERLCFFDRDDAFLADFLHCVGDHCADIGVAISRNRADL